MSTPDANGWLPIEIAPKNGTMILIYSPDRCGNCPKESVGIGAAYWHRQEFWCNGRLANGSYTWAHHEPTHWRPLPKPPVRP